MDRMPAGSKDLIVTPRLLYNNLSTGDAEFHDAKTMPLVEIDMWNHSHETIEVKLTTSINHYASPVPETTLLKPGQHQICRQMPKLLREKISELTEDDTVNVIIGVQYRQGGIKHDPEFPLPVTLRAYNTVLWAIPDPDSPGKRKFLLDHIVAWITRRDSHVQNILGSLPANLSRGYPKSNRPDLPKEQVKAIFNALQEAEKGKYASISVVKEYDKREICQYVWRPCDSLASGLSNCIDGAILYAALIEAIGLDPVIVIKENHAFVGWKTCNRDRWKCLLKEEKHYGFLETTRTQGHTFEDACGKGEELYEGIEREHWLEREPFSEDGFAVILDIAEQRARLEECRSQIKFSVIQDVTPAPAEKANKAPVNILDRMHHGATGAQAQGAEIAIPQPPPYLLVARDYVSDIQQRLKRVEPVISGNMRVEDCTFVINTLNVISAPPDLPGSEEESMAAGSKLAWENNLDALKRKVDEFNVSTEALREALRAQAAANSAASLRAVGAWADPVLNNIPTLFMNLSERAQKLAGQLKAAMRVKKTDRKKAEAR